MDKNKAKLVLTETVMGYRCRYWTYPEGECWFDVNEGLILSGAESSLTRAKITVRGAIKSVKAYFRSQKGQ